MLISVKLLQLRKHLSPIKVTEFGMKIFSKELQSPKEKLPIVVTVSDNVMLVNELHLLNEPRFPESPPETAVTVLSRTIE